MNKAIILAAGESYDTSDIFPKILLKNPISNETIIESFLKNYGENTLFVLGFRALSILNMHPHINVVLNHSWAITKSAYSLSLALNCLPPDEIVDIYSGDYFIEDEFFNEFKKNNAENILVASFRESRSKKACNLKVEKGIIQSKYNGTVEDYNDPESLGIIRTKVSNLKQWISKFPNNYKSLYSTDIIPNNNLKDFDLLIEKDRIFEINNANDFINYRSLKS